MLLGKIHRVRVTETDLNYIGSISIDRELLDAAGMLPGERILVVNLETGGRFETYVLEGRAGSGTIGVNGGAARAVQIGDRLLLCTFGWLDDAEARAWKPRVVFVDENNRRRTPGAGDA